MLVAGVLASGWPASGLDAQSPAAATRGAVPRDTARERVLMQQVKVADGFTATLFAAPPIAMYPVCLTATVDGAVFACIDPNLSLTAKKGAGRVVRLVDDNHDGVADRYTVFATMDSPRGVAYDGKTLYVMHPPNLTAYRDTTGDGIADVSEDLVTGLGFDLDFRGADHTTNGITLGIDGYLYIAVGDYGYRKAIGKDGTSISHRGGGVVRVRTDGRGLELFAEGTRNIYDLAVDPFLNVFTRDNTNDGDGWDIRLHFLPHGAHMGYPMYYKYFANEHMPSLADYGGGSGTGGLWVHDPGFPQGYGNTLYTSDWLLNQVFRHPLSPKGGSYDVKQENFVSVPHPADMAMDGRSNMFVASLAGGSYTYQGDSVGYILRVSPTGRRAVTPPVFDAAADVALRRLLTSGNAEYRLQAQREILRRGDRAGMSAALRSVVFDIKRPAYARVAAMYTLVQLVGVRAHGTLASVIAGASGDASVRASALRAITDDRAHTASVDPMLAVRALSDTNARVQMAALTAMVRLNARDSAWAIVPLLASNDPAIVHLAVNALVSLKASRTALNALQATRPALRAGALRVLQQIHEPDVVAELLRQPVMSGRPRDITIALARMYHREADWKGEWWGTRPNFVGPYFALAEWQSSPQIRLELQRAIGTASAVDSGLVDEYVRNRVVPRGARRLLLASFAPGEAQSFTVGSLIGHAQVPVASVPSVVRLAAAAPVLRPAIAELLAGEPAVLDGSLALVSALATDASIADETRAALLANVTAIPGRAGLDASTSLLANFTPAITPAGTPPGALDGAWRRYVGDRRRTTELDYFIELSRAATPDARVLGFAVLLQAVRGNRAPAAITDKVQPVLTAAWKSVAASPDLVRAVRVMRLESAYTEHLDAARTGPAKPPAMDWQPLFNGKDLKDWDVKFAGYPLGVNFRNTFRAESGMLRVNYDEWTNFNGEFGHLFYKKPFSYYIVAVEYRFRGQQVTGAGAGNSWAIRNNGIMVASQSAASMGLKQDFPISLEVQLLGGLGRGTRTTGNLCTPGMHVVMNDKLFTPHCVNSSSITYDGDQWVRAEAMVLGDSVVKHIINGDTVMTYYKPQMGGGAANNTNPGVLVEGKLIAEGYIALQAETAPIDFRKVEVVNLKGCTNPQDPNYRAYFVKSDPAACRKR